MEKKRRNVKEETLSRGESVGIRRTERERDGELSLQRW